MAIVKRTLVRVLLMSLVIGTPFYSGATWASGDSDHEEDGHGRDGEDHGRDTIDLSSFGECVASMETSGGGERGRSGEDHGEGHDSEHGHDEEHGGDDEDHGRGEGASAAADPDCTDRGLANERRVSWKEIKLQ